MFRDSLHELSMTGFYRSERDPFGVIQAFKRARKYVDCQLVMAGKSTSDHPEGAALLKEVRERDYVIFLLAKPSHSPGRLSVR